MFLDSDGNFPTWLKWTIGAGIIVGLGIAAIAVGGTIIVGSLVGASIGAGLGLVSGITLDNEGFKFDWDKAATGFMLGSITGAISGAIGAKIDTLSKFGTFAKQSITSGVDGVISLGAYFGQSAIHGERVSLGGALISLGSGLFSFADPSGSKVFDALWGPIMGAEIAWAYDMISSLNINKRRSARTFGYFNYGGN